ncbi:MAG: phosphopantetheine-binding protein [Puniceicoccales bacterium]|nr:phosphopantetheine-binding protein [Puniceicoccales bacterium]
MSNQKTPLSQGEERGIRETLKRCSAETIEAALLFRQSRAPDLANTIVIGVIARFLEPEQRAKLKIQGESDHLRLMDDLGVDSLTMVEAVMLIEEVLQISIKNEELRDLQTIGDIKAYVNAVASGLLPPEKPLVFDVASIAEAMPQQPPFLFIQGATLRPDEARGTCLLSGEEFFFEGHFKGRPVLPASIQIEALGQLAVLFLLKGKHPSITNVVDAQKIFFSSCGNVRCLGISVPGDLLTLTVIPKRIKYPIAVFDGCITVNGEKKSFAEDISLSFDYLSASAAVLDVPVAVSGINA